MKDYRSKAKQAPLAGIPNHPGIHPTLNQPSSPWQPHSPTQNLKRGCIVFHGHIVNAASSKPTNQKTKSDQQMPEVIRPASKVTRATQLQGRQLIPTNKASTKQTTDTKNQPPLQHHTIAASTTHSKDIARYDVMISYSHQDMDLMRFVLKSLRDRGLAVWVDQEGLKAGVDFLSKIGQAIVDSTCFLQILTPASVVSKYCRDELSLAYISNKSIHVLCNADKDDLFEKMDFGQKLTLAPYKSGFVDVSGLRLRKTQMDYMCDQIKSKIQKAKDTEEQKDARFLHTREKQLKSNDMSPEKFWEKYFGNKETLTWEQFIQTFIQHFGSVLQKTVPKEEQEWLLTVFEKEICDEDKYGQVSLTDLIQFCQSGTTTTHCVWESVERYAREQIAIKGVLTIDSSVRLDAIENLGKFKSPAVQEALLDLLKDPDPNVRSVAALSVARVSLEGDELKIATRVARLLKDRDRLVRESACVALGRMKAQNKVSDLVNVWRNDVISVVRDAAYLALELIGGEEAAEAIYVTNVLSEEIKAITSA